MRQVLGVVIGVFVVCSCGSFGADDNESPTPAVDAGTLESGTSEAGASSSGGASSSSGGEPGEDAGITPRVVQTTSRSIVATGTTKHTLTIRTANAAAVNDLLVLAIANQYGNAYPIQSVKDNVDHPYEMAVRSTDANGYTSEIWWTRTTMPGAQELTVELGGNLRLDLWLIDAAGFSRPDVTAMTKDTTVGSDNVLEARSVTPTSPPSLIVSATFYGAFAALGALDESNGFEEIERQSPYHAAAWKIATAPGSYGARWSATAGYSFSAVTASFKP